MTYYEPGNKYWEEVRRRAESDEVLTYETCVTDQDYEVLEFRDSMNEPDPPEFPEWELYELYTGSGRMSSLIKQFEAEEDALAYIEENKSIMPFANGAYVIIHIDDKESWRHFHKLDHDSFHNEDNIDFNCPFCMGE